MTETATPVPATGTVLMYSTAWCGYCRRLRTQLDSEGIGYEVIDIEERPETAAFVEQVNGGNRTVPTVVYPNGTAATNPSLADVRAALALAN